MTEIEWLACADPHPIWKCLHGRMSDRKRRLLYCGCCRHVWRLLVDDDSRRAVDAAERFADGLITRRTLRKHYVRANGVLQRVESDDVTPFLNVMVAAFAMCTTNPTPGGVHWYDDEVKKLQEAQEAHFLRDIFGNPFRAVIIDPAWRSWNDSTPVRLAQAIYDGRELPSGHLDPGRLAILADALEEAGCTDADILAHCRGPGPHVRGCWVVDLLLNKE